MAPKSTAQKAAAKRPRAQKPAPARTMPDTAAAKPRFSFRDDSLSPEALRKALEERARLLAQPPAAEETGRAIPVVSFRLGEEQYAIEVGYVEGIHPLQEWTPVPGAPDFCLGVVNLRGRIISVVDLHAFLGLGRVPSDGDVQIIAVNVDGLEVGLLASEVRSIGSLLLEKLAPVLPTTSRVAAEYARGVTPEMVVLLDLPALLRDRRMIVHEEL